MQRGDDDVGILDRRFHQIAHVDLLQDARAKSDFWTRPGEAASPYSVDGVAEISDALDISNLRGMVE